MTTLHFVTRDGRPVGLDAVEARADLSRAVFAAALDADDATVAVGARASWCTTCRAAECDHVDRVDDALAAAGLDGGAEGRP